MLRKANRAGAILVLIALLALSVRPIAVRAFGISPDPQDLKIVAQPGGGHCFIMSACDTITPNSIGMDAIPATLPLLVSLAVFTIAVVTRRTTYSVGLEYTNPPPRIALS